MTFRKKQTTRITTSLAETPPSSVSPRDRSDHNTNHNPNHKHNTKKQRRGRSLTARDPKKCTNAACNLGKSKRHMQTQTKMDALPDVDARLDRHGQRQRQRQRQHHRSLVEAAIDRLAIFGDSSLALMLSSLLLAVAFGLSLALEPVEGSGEGRFE